MNYNRSSLQAPLPETVEGCRIEQEHLMMFTAQLDADLAMAKARREMTGEMANREWFSEAQFLLKFAKLRKQRLQDKLGDIGRRERLQRSSELHSAFVSAAMGYLDSSVIAEIWDIVYSKNPHLKKN